MILAWTCRVISGTQTCDWNTHTHKYTHTLMQAMTIPKDQNWPRAKIICRDSYWSISRTIKFFDLLKNSTLLMDDIRCYPYFQYYVQIIPANGGRHNIISWWYRIYPKLYNNGCLLYICLFSTDIIFFFHSMKATLKNLVESTISII